jgi:hypothetical protein
VVAFDFELVRVLDARVVLLTAVACDELRTALPAQKEYR